MLLGLRSAINRVPDIEQGRDWYEAALQKSPYFNEPFYVGFNVGGFELGLLRAGGAKMADRAVLEANATSTCAGKSFHLV